MKNFIKMCNTAVLPKSYYSIFDLRACPDKGLLGEQIANPALFKNKHYSDAPIEFHEYLDESQPFVLDMEPVSMDSLDYLKELQDSTEFASGDYDMPFRVISIELSNSKDIDIGINYACELLQNEFEKGMNTADLPIATKAKMLDHLAKHFTKQKILCFMIIESAPRQYIGFWLSESIPDGGCRINKATDAQINHILEHYVSFINNQRCGLEKTKQKVKVGRGPDRHIREINKVIHVTSKKNQSDYERNKNIDFEYSHRFLVRGHWRKIPENSLGKNRSGEYSVQGMTWVTEFEKGSKDLPLIKKVRVVHRREEQAITV